MNGYGLSINRRTDRNASAGSGKESISGCTTWLDMGASVNSGKSVEKTEKMRGQTTAGHAIEKPENCQDSYWNPGTYLNRIRMERPLIHCITNYVTANDCANVLLAIGASPVMADDASEVTDITAKSAALVLNLGTLHQETVPAMLAAGREANRWDIPIILDPVGAGASKHRTETARMLLDELSIAAVRGNASEVKALALGWGGARGVDADEKDAMHEGSRLEEAMRIAAAFARREKTVAAVTGETDIVTDGMTAYCIQNGSPLMQSVTGAGCQLSALTAAFAAAAASAGAEPHARTDRNKETDLTEAVAAAVCAMGVCGELAEKRMTPPDGSGSYRVYLMDAVSNLTEAQLHEHAKVTRRQV